MKNTKTPSTHSRLGSATLLQLTFPGESNPNFPREKSQGDNTLVKNENKKKKRKKRKEAELQRSWVCGVVCGVWGGVWCVRHCNTKL